MDVQGQIERRLWIEAACAALSCAATASEAAAVADSVLNEFRSRFEALPPLVPLAPHTHNEEA